MASRSIVKQLSKNPGNVFAGSQGYFSLGTKITNSLASTAVMYVGGQPLGRIWNNSGSSISLTFYDMVVPSDDDSLAGDALAVLDSSNAAVPAFVVADDRSRQLPAGLNAITYLVLLGAADYTALDNIYLSMGR